MHQRSILAIRKPFIASNETSEFCWQIGLNLSTISETLSYTFFVIIWQPQVIAFILQLRFSALKAPNVIGNYVQFEPSFFDQDQNYRKTCLITVEI